VPPDEALLDADIQLRLERISLEASLQVGPGQVLALLGPNGSGKSTVLNALAGLLKLGAGHVILDGVVLERPASRTRVRPERRPVALMFQDYLLFPHMTALDNVAFGLRARGTGKAQSRERAAAALERVGLTEVAAARPGAMSGGQQQRVAMARALVTEPRLLLLDEPLAALDVSTKTGIRRQLRSILRASSAANILVTHDLLDAVALADTMVVIERGSIVQSGTPAEVTARPRSRYVADLVGVNLLQGTGRGTVVELDSGGELHAASGEHGPVLASVNPARVSVARERPGQAGQAGANCWRGTIEAVDLLGDRVRVNVAGPLPIIAEVAPSAVGELRLDDLGELWTCVDPADVQVYAR
jgi:molybdate transport system ATP-binding protein